MRHIIETRHLKIFVAVYKSQSFTKASELLHTSQPTVSEHIRNLESRLDCKLFDRLGRSIMPTPQAEVLYPKALAILEDLKKLEDEVNFAGDMIAGELCIGASTIPGAYILPSLAAKFKETYPAVSFEIKIADSQQIINKIVEHKLLLGIVGAKLPSKKVDYIPFIEDELILVSSIDRDLAPKISVKTLLTQPFLFREDGSGTRRNVESLLGQKNIRLNQLNTSAILGSSTAIKEAIKADLGISILSKCAVQDELDCGLLKQVHVEGLSLKRAFYIVTAQRRTLPNHYKIFLNSLLRDVTL